MVLEEFWMSRQKSHLVVDKQFHRSSPVSVSVQNKSRKEFLEQVFVLPALTLGVGGGKPLVWPMQGGASPLPHWLAVAVPELTPVLSCVHCQSKLMLFGYGVWLVFTALLSFRLSNRLENEDWIHTP